ncbi:MAG: hypothetical protein QW837_06150, partial [Conexivisphaerales archaeon]
SEVKANLKVHSWRTLIEGSRTGSVRKGGSHGLPSIGPCQKVYLEMAAQHTFARREAYSF